MYKRRSALTRYDDYYEMLSDEVRTKAYKKAIQQTVKKGDIVVDLGSGTGILGLMAIKAGASKVYMIEKSDSIELAKEIVAHNGLNDKVVFFQSNSLEVVLPEKVDIIISETLGSFGIDENTVPFIVDARKRFLKDTGTIIPNKITVHIEPVESNECHEKLNFWKKIGGIDFSPAYHIFSQKIMIEEFQSENILSKGDPCFDIDFMTIENTPLFSTTYHGIDRPGTIHGFVGWFDLELAPKVMLSTSPKNPKTHWKQAFFPIQTPISVIKNDITEVQVLVKPKADNSDDTIIQYTYRCSQRANNN